jgi:hypothetical protein
MKKLALLMVLIVGIAWAFIPTTSGDVTTVIEEPVPVLQGYDISVDSAWVDPEPAMVDEVTSIWAQLTNHYSEPFSNIPIHGLIAQLLGEQILVDEDFENPPFPPDDWDTVMTDASTSGSVRRHWWRYNYGSGYNMGTWGAYVWWSYNHQDEWLITPDIDLTGLAPEDGAKLIFHSAFYPTPTTQYDYVCISTDGGATWEDTLVDLTKDLGLPNYTWVLSNNAPNPLEFDLSGYAGQTIRVGFNYRYDPAGSGRGIWTVDDVMVVTQDYDVIWSSDETVPSLAASSTDDYEFVSTWTPEETGVYLLRVWTTLPDDNNLDNNLYSREFIVGAGIDLAMEAIIRPEDYEVPYSSFRPHCVVDSRGMGACTAAVRCKIDSVSTTIYDEKLNNYPLEPGLNHVEEFDEFTMGAARTIYEVLFVVEHDDDPDDRDNDINMIFRSGWPRMVNPTTAIVPEEDGQYYTLTPEAIFVNEGGSIEDDWWGFVRFEDMTYHAELWRDSVHVTDPDFLVLADTTLTFGEFSTSPGESYTCIFWTAASVPDYGSAELAVGFIGSTAVDEERLPSEYSLEVISAIADGFAVSYAMPVSGNVSLRVYDISGKLVDVLCDGDAAVGHHSLDWDAGKLPAGLYFLRMETPGFSATRKLVLIR